MASVACLIACGNPGAFNLAPRSEAFGQHVVYNTKVDVLWVVDNSSSMGKHQQSLTNQFGAFVDYLVASKFDFRLAVTTTDVGSTGEKGAFVGNIKVLDRNTPALKQNFVQNALVGESGSDLERGLSAVKMALDPAMLGGVNSGFFRSDALLAIVVLSDEEDFSGSNTSVYSQFLDQLKPLFPGGSRGWVFNSIIVPELNSTCKTFNEFASPGERYKALSEESGGAIESICSSDLTGALSSIRARIVEMLTEYHLGKKPDLTSLHVFVNGVELPNDATNGWTYHPEGYTIKFHGTGVPAADAFVQIDYTPSKT